MKLTRSLVGIDLSHGDRLVSKELSEASENAVQLTLAHAKQVGAEVTFFSAIDISEQALELIHAHESRITQSVHDSAIIMMDQLCERAKAMGVKANHRFSFSRPWLGIIQEVLDGDYDVVIVGAREKTTISRISYGSTSLRLMRKCPIPVVVLKQDTTDIQSVLAADDFSDIGERVLDHALAAAQLFDAKFHVVHAEAFENDYQLIKTGMPAEMVRDRHAKILEQAEANLAERLSRTDFRTLNQGTKTHVLNGIPEDVIADLVDSEQIDLLVMGTVGRSGIPGLLIGNTCERLLNTLNCSLLVVKPDDFECPVKPVN